MSNKTIKYTVTNEEYKIIEHEAISKGMKPSSFTKVAVFAYVSKYPAKGIFSLLTDSGIDKDS